MKIKLKTLTPVYIGSGEEISPIEYFLFNTKKEVICENFNDADRFIRLDMDGLFSDSDFKPLMEKFIESAKYQRYIGILLPKDLLVKHQLYSLDISRSTVRSNPIAIKSFIKSAGRVYIPGSSLKGSILSAVIYKIAKQERITDLKNYEALLSVVISASSNRIMDTKNQTGNRFSRWLDVSDSNFKAPEGSLEISLAKVEGARGGGRLPVLFEVLKPGITFEMEIKISIDSIDKFGKLSEEEILKIVDEFYKKVYEKESKSKLAQSLPKISKDNFLFRIGQGSTCFSTSFLILAEELGIKDYKIFRPRIRGRNLPPIRPGEEPWTRKLISKTIPFGWIEVSYA